MSIVVSHSWLAFFLIGAFELLHVALSLVIIYHVDNWPGNENTTALQRDTIGGQTVAGITSAKLISSYTSVQGSSRLLLMGPLQE